MRHDTVILNESPHSLTRQSTTGLFPNFFPSLAFFWSYNTLHLVCRLISVPQWIAPLKCHDVSDWNSLQTTFQDDRTFSQQPPPSAQGGVVEICKNVCKTLAPKPSTSGNAPGLPAYAATSSAAPSSTGIWNQKISSVILWRLVKSVFGRSIDWFIDWLMGCSLFCQSIDWLIGC